MLKSVRVEFNILTPEYVLFIGDTEEQCVKKPEN